MTVAHFWVDISNSYTGPGGLWVPSDRGGNLVPIKPIGMLGTYKGYRVPYHVNGQYLPPYKFFEYVTNDDGTPVVINPVAKIQGRDEACPMNWYQMITHMAHFDPSNDVDESTGNKVSHTGVMYHLKGDRLIDKTDPLMIVDAEIATDRYFDIEVGFDYATIANNLKDITDGYKIPMAKALQVTWTNWGDEPYKITVRDLGAGALTFYTYDKQFTMLNGMIQVMDKDMNGPGGSDFLYKRYGKMPGGKLVENVYNPDKQLDKYTAASQNKFLTLGNMWIAASGYIGLFDGRVHIGNSSIRSASNFMFMNGKFVCATGKTNNGGGNGATFVVETTNSVHITDSILIGGDKLLEPLNQKISNLYTGTVYLTGVVVSQESMSTVDITGEWVNTYQKNYIMYNFGRSELLSPNQTWSNDGEPNPDSVFTKHLFALVGDVDGDFLTMDDMNYTKGIFGTMVGTDPVVYMHTKERTWDVAGLVGQIDGGNGSVLPVDYALSDWYGGRRDGIGALYFPEMDTSSVSITCPSVVTTGDVARVVVGSADFLAEYLSQEFSFKFDNKSPVVVFKPDGVDDSWVMNRDVPTDSNGSFSIEIDVYSFHGTYKSTYSVPIVVEAIGADFDFDVDTSAVYDEYDTIIVGRPYKFTVTNKSTKKFALSEVVVEYSDINAPVINGLNRYVTTEASKLSVLGNTGGTLTDTLIVHKPYGWIEIDCVINLGDGSVVSISKMYFVEAIARTFFVDLSQEYEDNDAWLTLRSGYYDNFDNGRLSNTFAHLSGKVELKKYNRDVFITPTTNTSTGTNMLTFKGTEGTGVDSTYKFEWSFVRNEDAKGGGVGHGLTYTYISFGTNGGWIPIPIIVMDTMKFYWYDADPRWVYVNTHNGKYRMYLNGAEQFPDDAMCDDAIHTVAIQYGNSNKNRTINFKLKGVGDWSPFTIIQKYDAGVLSFIDTKFEDLIKPSLTGIVIFGDNANMGLGYIKGMSDKAIMPIDNGSEDHPLTYPQMKTIIEGSGKYGDIFKCRGYRNVKSGQALYVDGKLSNSNLLKYQNDYEITGWNLLQYGPWVLGFDGSGGGYVSFYGSRISNGVIYSTGSGHFLQWLIVQQCYDMMITWKSDMVKSLTANSNFWKNSPYYTSRIVGSTISQYDN